MIKKLPIVELMKSIKMQLSNLAEIPVYDTKPPVNAKGPYYLIEYISAVPSNTKYSLREKHMVYVHLINKVNGSNAKLYNLLDDIDRFMESNISVPEGIELEEQTGLGTIALKEDETKEYHGIKGFEFLVTYGLKIK